MTRLVEEWQMFDHSVIKQWRPRLRLCVREQGRHFEHQLHVVQPEFALLTVTG